MKSKKLIILIMIIFVLSGCNSKTYKVTFNTTGGSKINDITIKEGKTLENIKIPKKEGYLFVNWNYNNKEYKIDTPVKENLELVATWVEEPNIKNIYTVTYVVDGKEEITKVPENTKIEKTKIPKKKDHIALGWYLNDELYNFNSQVTKDIVLVAKYKHEEVEVTFIDDENNIIKKEVILKNSTVNIPEIPKKEGYRFLKWIYNDKDFSFNVKINKNIILKAIFEKIEYITINLDTNGGEPLENIIIPKHEKIINLPIPVKVGYKFENWKINNKVFNIDDKINSDITLVASWIKEDNLIS